ncbi:MAG: DUF6326 family protein [Xenococcaceae cyanobacterium MO_167.B52]|nr:DUF6326 family protein [Xenococcaceae cyanobacterium MO_167.B52]
MNLDSKILRQDRNIALISSNNRVEIDKKPLLSTLWIFVLLNIILRDIHEFFRLGLLEEMMTGVVNGNQVTEQVMLIGAFMVEIPILMVLLSRILNYRINRWTNITIGAVTIALVIGMGQKDLDDIFFATVEVIALSAIIWLAAKWQEAIKN